MILPAWAFTAVIVGALGLTASGFALLVFLVVKDIRGGELW